MAARPLSPAKTVSVVAKRFGKVGLLIDDAHLAASRTARALYFSDELPEFWVHVETVDAGVSQLRELQLHRDVPRLVVVDRMLPPNDTEGPSYWDEAAARGESPAKEFGDLIESLARSASTHQKLLRLTSYPPANASTRHIWEARSHEPLHRLRTACDLTGELAALWQCAPEDAVEAATGRAVRRLSTWLHDRRCHTILVTGAGMSFASCPEFPGMPWNAWLLALAAYETCQEVNRGSPWMLPPPVWARQGSTQRAVPHPIEPLRGYEDEPKMRELINELIRTGTIKDGSNFNALFRDELRPDSLEQKFRRHFKRAVLRYDTGLTQRHWLAASLPFDAIVTTNFDGFHQRARAHVLARHRAFDTNTVAPVISAYGNAADNYSSLAFSPREFESNVANVLASELDELPKKRTINVVVVGYSFQDATLGRAIAELGAEEVFWVVPEAGAVHAAQKPVPVGLQRLADFTPVPMTAVDFFHDLSMERVRSKP